MEEKYKMQEVKKGGIIENTRSCPEGVGGRKDRKKKKKKERQDEKEVWDYTEALDE